MAGHCGLARRLFVAAAFVVTFGCGEQGPSSPSTVRFPPTSSSSPAPASPFAPRDVAGTAFEYTESGDRRPIANLRLKVRAPGPTGGPIGGLELPDVITDEHGRYMIPEVSALFLYIETAPESQYSFLCDSYPLLGLGDSGFDTDLPLVHITWSGDSPPWNWISGTSVWGRVSERDNGILRPVAGVTVTIDEGNPDGPAITTASGFYMICSATGTDQVRTITARKDGYRTATRESLGGWESSVHFELDRE